MVYPEYDSGWSLTVDVATGVDALYPEKTTQAAQGCVINELHAHYIHETLQIFTRVIKWRL